MASAIRMGSFAPAMAVFIRTASAPYSIARAASEAVPTPASTMTGTFTDSMRIFRLYGLRIPRPDRIVVSVRKHDEAFLDENLRRLDQARRIGEQRALVAYHLQLHHVGHAGGPGESRVAQGVLHGVTARRVGQDLVFLRADVVEEVLGLPIRDVDPAHGDRHHVRARRLDGLLGLDEVLVFARAYPESGAELDARDRQPIIVHDVCPPRRR